MDLGLRYAAEFQIPPILEFSAIILFAITGALSAARRGYDWIGTMSIALVTGCGGGLIRDLLLNVRPVFLEHEAYIGAMKTTLILPLAVLSLAALAVLLVRRAQPSTVDPEPTSPDPATSGETEAATTTAPS